jgi:hypothetical protein
MFVIAVFVIAVPRFASADPPGLTASADTTADEDYGAHPRLGVQVGLAMPNGEVGVEYTRPIAKAFEIGFGAGVGFSHNPQVSVMPRVRLGRRGFAMTFGAGVSGGPNTLPECLVDVFDDEGCMDTHADFVAWANVEAGAEWTRRSGLSFRMFAGYGRSFLAAGCAGDECGQLASWGLPYFGIQLGHTL